jgi:hypothetical protein
MSWFINHIPPRKYTTRLWYTLGDLNPGLGLNKIFGSRCNGFRIFERWIDEFDKYIDVLSCRDAVDDCQ